MRIDKVTRPRKNGPPSVRFRADAGKDPRTGKKRRKTFKTRAEAKAWLQAGAAAEDSPTAPGRTLAWLGKQYVDDRKNAGRERATYEKYDQHFKQHICKLAYSFDEEADPAEDETLDGVSFGDFKPAEMKARHFVKLKRILVATRSHAMALRVWSTLAAALDHGIAIEEVEANLARSIKIDRQPRTAGETVTIPTKPEIAKFMEAARPAQGEPIYLGQAMIATTLTTGLRPSEMRALPWTCVRIDEAPYQVAVTERVDQWYQAGPPKSAAGYREIPLPESTVKLLREWRLRCPKVGPLNLVFPTSAGTYQNLSNIHNRIWNPFQVALGIADPKLNDKGLPVLDEDGAPIMEGRYTWYAMRHAYASMQIALGLAPKRLQERMGHASVQTTLDLYGHLWNDKAADAADMKALDQWLKDLPAQ